MALAQVLGSVSLGLAFVGRGAQGTTSGERRPRCFTFFLSVFLFFFFSIFLNLAL